MAYAGAIASKGLWFVWWPSNRTPHCPSEEDIGMQTAPSTAPNWPAGPGVGELAARTPSPVKGAAGNCSYSPPPTTTRSRLRAGEARVRSCSPLPNSCRKAHAGRTPRRSVSCPAWHQRTMTPNMSVRIDQGGHAPEIWLLTGPARTWRIRAFITGTRCPTTRGHRRVAAAPATPRLATRFPEPEGPSPLRGRPGQLHAVRRRR